MAMQPAASAPEAKQQVLRQIRVTPQMLALAKPIVLEAASSLSLWNEILAVVLRRFETRRPDTLMLRASGTESAIKDLADHHSWYLAACEAILSLVHTGQLVPIGGLSGDLNLGVVTQPGAAGIDFPELQMQLPQRLRRALSFQGATTSLFLIRICIFRI